MHPASDSDPNFGPQSESRNSGDVLAAFLRVWFADEEAGTIQILRAYQERFPGHEATIAAAHAELMQRSTHVETKSERRARTFSDSPSRIGAYEIERLLGSGGQGQVFLARDPRLLRQVAIKILHTFGFDPGEVQRFRREAEVAARLKHPAICPVYELDEEAGRPFLVMPYLRGRTLAQVIAEARIPLNDDALAARLEWIETVARGVDAAHEAGVIHRDLKPANIFIDETHSPLILDFGLARDLTRDATLKTRTGAILGTLAYMAPERLRARTPSDRRADVYALGVTLFEAVTGSLPFASNTEAGIIEAILNDPPQDARAVNPAVSADLAVVLQTALERSPERRYRTARDFADEIGRLRTKEPVLARPLAWPRRFARWMQRRPAVAAGLGVGVLGLGVALAVALSLLSNLSRAQREVRGLADAKRVQDLLREEESLWPALPENAAGLKAWITRAEVQLSQRTSQAAFQKRLELDLRDASPGSEELTWISWQLQVLSELDRELGTLEERLPSVLKRRDFAETVQARSLVDPKDDWERDRAYAAREPRYRGLELHPVLGLVPLGPDPESGYLEFAHSPSGDVPLRDPDHGRLRLSGASGVVLVLLPGGKFRIGATPPDRSTESPIQHPDPSAEKWEFPEHEVNLAPYFLSKYEVTQGQWLRWTGRNPSRYPVGMKMDRGPVTELHPVESVPWTEASRTLARLGLSLPTEAQWESAARARSKTRYFSGDTIDDLAGVANLKDESCARVIGTDLGKHETNFDDGYAAPAPVFALAPNPFGLHGVHGNVAEWCADAFGTYDLPVRTHDGRRETPEDGYRALRGGSYLQLAWNARSSNRAKLQQSLTDFTIGLRPSLTYPH